MLGFMGPDRPSSFCNYYVESHLSASSREQGPDFELVGTCEWLSYVRASRSQAYGVLAWFFPCRVYIDLSHRDTLGYEWQLIVAVIS
jgi:hypothetical protein